MSEDAMQTIAQIVPVLLLALVLEVGLQATPGVRRWERLAGQVMLTVAIGGLAILECLLVWAMVNDHRLTPGWTVQFVSLGVLIVVLPYLAGIWGLRPRDPVAAVRERNRAKDAERLAKLEREADKLRARLNEERRDDPPAAPGPSG